MLQAYKKIFQNYANFNGRASIKDYWLAFAMNFIIAIVLGMISGIITFICGMISEDLMAVSNVLISIVTGLYSLAIVVPFIALAVRRLHDQGRPGWIVAACYLGSLCCGIGSIALIVFMCLPGTVGPNQYGDDPNNLYNNYNGMNQQYNNYGQNNMNQQQYNGYDQNNNNMYQ